MQRTAIGWAVPRGFREAREQGAQQFEEELHVLLHGGDARAAELLVVVLRRDCLSPQLGYLAQSLGALVILF